MDEFDREKSSEGTSYSHQFLWTASRFALESAEKEVVGRDFNFLSAFLISFLAFEAYVNFLGEIVFPRIWDKIKTSRIRDKTDLLDSELSLKVNKNSPEYSQFLKAQELRNKISHPKTYRWSEKKIISDNEGETRLPSFPLPWDEIHDVSKIKNFRESLEKLADSMHQEIKNNHSKIDLEGLDSAFGGVMARSSYVIKPVPKVS